MLFKIDYQKRSDFRRGIEDVEYTKYVNHVADQTEAGRRFLDWFFVACPEDAVKIPFRCTEIEIIGDLSGVDLIDEAVSGPGHEG